MKIHLLLVLLGFPVTLLAQRNGIIRGLVYDTAARQPVPSATVTLLQQKDSTLVSFTMTDEKGHFEIPRVANGRYRLLVSHIHYHNAAKYLTVSDSMRTIDLGQVAMTNASTTLEEVIVTAEAPPVTLSGDTVVYNAGSFKVQPNATVEDMLKKLPGIKVEKDGSITAQGQTVKRVLVDGKEFFGNDPKIATRNLQADAVDKVQAYDKASDAAQLTGFDDGNSERTLNLQLKKDRKKGYFGNLKAGAGTDGRFEGNFNLNSFKGSRQLSVLGMSNNINAEGFTGGDMLSAGPVGGGRSGITMVSASSSSGGGGAGSGGNGISTRWAGGLNYNNMIGTHTDLASNYFYNRTDAGTESNTRRTYLDEKALLYEEQAAGSNINNAHRLNLTADIQLDSFDFVKISPSLGVQDSRTGSYKNYQTLSGGNRPANEGFSDNTGQTNGYTFSNDLSFRKKFRRSGRTFYLGLQNNLVKSDGDGMLVSVNRFFNDAGSPVRTDSINQRNTTINDQNGYTLRVAYTEPLFKKSLLEFSASKSNSRNSSEKSTWDRNGQTGKYDLVNEELTNDYENTYGSTSAGLKILTKAKKYSWSLGLGWQRAELEGQITTGLKDSVISKTFYNLLPNARLQYSFSSFTRLTLNYNTNTRQPSASQLQPVPDVSDPLNISEGNPGLKQEYNHTVNLSFMMVNPYEARNLFAFLTIQQTHNRIVNSDSIDTYGVKYTRPVNVDGVYSLSGDIRGSLPLLFMRGSVNLGSSISYNRGKQFIDRQANDISTLSLGPDLRLDLNLTEKLDISLNAGYSFNKTKYSLRSSMNNSYFNQEYGADINCQLPWNIYFNSAFTYTINNQLAEGYNARVPLWNASLSKQLLKGNRGELKLSAFDLLNQNVGVTRNTNQNYIEDIRNTILQQYFLLSFSYRLMKGEGPSAVPAGGMRMFRR